MTNQTAPTNYYVTVSNDTACAYTAPSSEKIVSTILLNATTNGKTSYVSPADLIQLLDDGGDDKQYPDAAFEQFDQLLLMGTANAAAEYLGHGEFTDEEMEDGWFDYDIADNEVFSSLSVLFNEDPDDDEYTFE